MFELKNPFIFAPIKLGYSDGSGRVTEKHISFYSVRNKHVGAITLEPLYMDKGLREIPTQSGIGVEMIEKTLTLKSLKQHVVGDAKKVGKAQDAIRDGFQTASRLNG